MLLEVQPYIFLAHWRRVLPSYYVSTSGHVSTLGRDSNSSHVSTWVRVLSLGNTIS